MDSERGSVVALPAAAHSPAHFAYYEPPIHPDSAVAGFPNEGNDQLGSSSSLYGLVSQYQQQHQHLAAFSSFNNNSKLTSPAMDVNMGDGDMDVMNLDADTLQQSNDQQQASTNPKRLRPPPAKSFQCRGYGDCRMVFSRSEHLARHVRKHTGERPFTCHCSKQFSRLDNLRQHAQTVHADRVADNERMMRELTGLHATMAAVGKTGKRGRNASNAAAPPPPAPPASAVENPPPTRAAEPQTKTITVSPIKQEDAEPRPLHSPPMSAQPTQQSHYEQEQRRHHPYALAPRPGTTAGYEGAPFSNEYGGIVNGWQEGDDRDTSISPSGRNFPDGSTFRDPSKRGHSFRGSTTKERGVSGQSFRDFRNGEHGQSFHAEGERKSSTSSSQSFREPQTGPDDESPRRNDQAFREPINNASIPRPRARGQSFRDLTVAIPEGDSQPFRDRVPARDGRSQPFLRERVASFTGASERERPSTTHSSGREYEFNRERPFTARAHTGSSRNEFTSERPSTAHTSSRKFEFTSERPSTAHTSSSGSGISLLGTRQSTRLPPLSTVFPSVGESHTLAPLRAGLSASISERIPSSHGILSAHRILPIPLNALRADYRPPSSGLASGDAHVPIGLDSGFTRSRPGTAPAAGSSYAGFGFDGHHRNFSSRDTHFSFRDTDVHSGDDIDTDPSPFQFHAPVEPKQQQLEPPVSTNPRKRSYPFEQTETEKNSNNEQRFVQQREYDYGSQSRPQSKRLSVMELCNEPSSTRPGTASALLVTSTSSLALVDRPGSSSRDSAATYFSNEFISDIESPFAYSSSATNAASTRDDRGILSASAVPASAGGGRLSASPGLLSRNTRFKYGSPGARSNSGGSAVSELSVSPPPQRYAYPGPVPRDSDGDVQLPLAGSDSRSVSPQYAHRPPVWSIPSTSRATAGQQKEIQSRDRFISPGLSV